MSSFKRDIESAVHDILAPLLEADGGGVEVLSIDEGRREVVLRFTGALAVCPGTPTVREDVVEPLLRARTSPETTFKYQR